jgi:tight adherence protein C
MAALTGLVAVAVSGRALAVVPGAAIGAALGLAWLRRRARHARERRSRAIRTELPDALDLLAAAVDGGAAPNVALECVCQRLPGTLSAVLASTIEGEIDGTGERIAAIDPALRPLGALLQQSDDLGVPVAAALRLLAADARQRLRAELRERAAAAAPRMLLVIGALLAPAALLVVIGGQALALHRALA